MHRLLKQSGLNVMMGASLESYSFTKHQVFSDSRMETKTFTEWSMFNEALRTWMGATAATSFLVISDVWKWFTELN